jgi:hypothetical protein
MSPIDVFISYPHSKEGEHRVLNPGEHFEKEFSERNWREIVCWWFPIKEMTILGGYENFH